MRILIACEESGAVRDAFIDRGFDAYSNDLKVSRGKHPEKHIQGDCLDAIRSQRWGFIGLHPVCTAMTVSGNRTYAPGKTKHHLRLEAVAWTITLWQLACTQSDHVYMENPKGVLNSDRRLPRPQIIQPYYFGDEFQKTTCLWLKGLPRLIHHESDNLFAAKTHVGRGEMVKFESGAVMAKWYADAKALPEFERKELRSKTFPGIASAMAIQWGDYLKWI